MLVLDIYMYIIKYRDGKYYVIHFISLTIYTIYFVSSEYIVISKQKNKNKKIYSYEI